MVSRARRSLAPAFFAMALLVIFANSWFAVRSLNVLVDSENWVQHTWQVISQVERIMSSAKDAETGTRGFFITGREAYLQPFLDGSRQLPVEVDQLAQLTQDNPAQRGNIANLRSLLTLRLATLAHIVDVRRNNPAAMADVIKAGTGKQQMDQLRSLADTMESEEHRLLILRVAASRSASREAHLTIALASGLDLLLLLLMFRYFILERGLRVASELAAEQLHLARNEAEHNAAMAERSADEAKRSAAEVLALNATLEQRVIDRTAELENTNRELEAFSYSVSHDLRAPLRTIDGFSLALEEDFAEIVGDTGKDYIGRVRFGVQRMGQLIDALLQLSRITRAEISREPVDVTALATAVSTDIREAKAGGPNLAFTIDPGLRADADPKLLRVALENLFGNAAKFSSKVANPAVHFGWDPAEQAFFVRDNGAGFDMQYADRLFGAFNRLHGDKDFKGSGIGLATVARVIHRHHGRIWAQAVVDHGATFWFTLR